MRTSWLAIAAIAGCTTADDARFGERQQADSTATYHEVFSGTEARATWGDQTTTLNIDLFQNSSTVYGGETFVFFQYGVADPTSLVCYGYCFYAKWTFLDGFGQIPRTDAQITPGAAQLHTSTTVEGFTTTQCTYDQRDGSYVCTTPPTGTIDVTWNQDGFTSDFATGTSRQETPNFTTQTQGTFWSNSARASGTVVGNAFDGAYGSLADTRNNYVTKSFTRNH